MNMWPSPHPSSWLVSMVITFLKNQIIIVFYKVRADLELLDGLRRFESPLRLLWGDLVAKYLAPFCTILL